MRSPAVPVSCETEPTIGAAGADASIVHVPMLVGCDSFPAASFAVIESGCWPSASTLVVTLYEPFVCTTAVPTSTGVVPEVS